MVSNESVAKNWFLTVPNYLPEDESFFETIEYGSNILYSIVGKEVGAGGLRHLQCVVMLRNRTRFTAVRNLLRLSTQSHLECCRNVKHSIEYCKKVCACCRMQGF
jgi:hypothetical protein